MSEYRVVIEWTGQIDLPRGTVDSNGTELHVGDTVATINHPAYHYRITNDWWDRGVFKGVWLEAPGLLANYTTRTRTATTNLVKVSQ